MNMTHHAAIRRAVFAWYRRHGRHELPWRKTWRPYTIVVSEMMLQQTTVPTVIPRYRAFLRTFPSWRALSRAAPADVLRAWRGLGYNRRALYLHESAKIIVQRYNSRLPRDPKVLRALPGFGAYMSRAVVIFSYNAPYAAVDVNIARLLSRWGICASDATPTQYEAAAMQMLPERRSRQWHGALMDFASAICRRRTPRCDRCPVATQCASAFASFENSRQIKTEPTRMECGVQIPRRIYRGRIVDVLRDVPQGLSRDTLGVRIKQDYRSAIDGVWLDNILKTLASEGIVTVQSARWRLVT